jgi:hypothetical protein
MLESMTLNTTKTHSPTGLGAGIMYISTDRKSYRTTYAAKNNFGTDEDPIVAIGRPIQCTR